MIKLAKKLRVNPYNHLRFSASARARQILNIAMILCVLLIPLVPLSVSAGLGDAQKQLEEAGGKSYGEGAETEIEPVIASIINTLLSITGVIFLILMVYGGFLWMTARENVEQAKNAKNVLTAAFIGIIIVFLAYGITYFVVEQLMAPRDHGGVLDPYPDD